MNIVMFLVSWLAVGLLVALALGKIVREANEFNDHDPQRAEEADAPIDYPGLQRHRSKRKRAKGARVPLLHDEDAHTVTS
ncbi:MAG: hypothetical protein ACE5K1_07600 [Acidiferrobacterales bacterium]